MVQVTCIHINQCFVCEYYMSNDNDGPIIFSVLCVYYEHKHTLVQFRKYILISCHILYILVWCSGRVALCVTAALLTEHWSLPAASAARPASPCSGISPPAARSADWRCPAWSLSVHLKKKTHTKAFKNGI